MDDERLAYEKSKFWRVIFRNKMNRFTAQSGFCSLVFSNKATTSPSLLGTLVRKGHKRMSCLTVLVLVLLFVALCTGNSSNGDVEKALEETIRGSLSLDFNMHSRDEDLYVLIINQDGYEVCKGMINRQNIDQIRCTFSKDILNRGDNKFDITVYSPKNRVLVLKSSTIFNYNPKSGNPISEAIIAMKDSVFCRDGKCPEGASREDALVRRDPLKKLLVASGAIAAAGVFASYIWPLAFGTKRFPNPPVVAPLEEFLPPPPPPPSLPPADGPDIFKPDSDRPRPPAPSGLRPPSRLSSVLSSAKRSIRTAAATRPAKFAVFLCAVALMHPSSLQSLSDKFLSMRVPTRPVVYPYPRLPAGSPVQAGNRHREVLHRPVIRTVPPEVRRAIEREIHKHHDLDAYRVQRHALSETDQARMSKLTRDLHAARRQQRRVSRPRFNLGAIPEFFSHLLIHHIPEVATHVPEMAKKVTIRNTARLVNEGILPRLAALKKLIL